MKFIKESPSPHEGQEVQASNEDQPVNVGVRLKKLKTPDNPPDTEESMNAMDSNFGLELNAQTEASKVLVTKPSVEDLEAEPLLKIKSGRGRKSIRQISEEADLIQIPEDEILFLKQYYTMGEVADMFRVNQSLLRFWEAEFSILQPKKNKKGDRYFRPVDIKNLHLIYHLLRQRKYTIEGAKDFLKKNSNAEEKFEALRKLEEVKRFLLEMRASIR